MTVSDRIASSEPLQLAPPGVQVERVSEADRRLIMRLEARIAALQASAQELQGTITNHLAAEYELKLGDKIDEDGDIVRAAPPAENSA